MLPFAVIAITAALVFYTVGVWGEKIRKTLKPLHVVLFWLGLICDCAGTALMSSIAASGEGASNPFHAISGVAAIVLMLFHAAWATAVLLLKQEKTILTFHKFSLFVWIVWLIPYFSGMIMGMSR
ncbi:MAG: TIGR03987 family protein [Oscillospiraceae bacterium]|jgi:uncharacterized repeat protein (TIGR03987 family)|nr:TIGR03987 family protein [Oscillospiraceae bacterium]